MNSILLNKKAYLYLILVLFGSFCIGYNITIACHELGHAFAVVLDGGHIQEFVLNPFSWSWNLGQNLMNPLFTAWGGVTFGLLFALLPGLILFARKRYFLQVPILVTVGCAFLINGIYLLMGVFLKIGDGGELIEYGVPAAIILIIGIVYFITAIFVWSIIQQVAGLKSDLPFTKRLILMCCGITPYLLMIVIYNLIFNKAQIIIWSAFAIIGLFICIIFSITGLLMSNLYPGNYNLPDFANKKPIVIINIIGIAIIACEFIIFGIQENPF